MAIEITVCFDYVCPFCYLASNALEQAARGKDIFFRYVPYELRRAPEEKADPMHDEMRLKRFEEFLLPTAKRLGVEMKLPWISPHPYTTVPLQGFHYVKEHFPDKLSKYNKHVYNAFYIDEKDIGEPLIVEEVLADLEIPTEPFRKILADGTYFQLIIEEKQWCEEVLGIETIPAYFINGRKLSGVLHPDRLEKAILAEMEQENASCISSETINYDPSCDANGCQFS